MGELHTAIERMLNKMELATEENFVTAIAEKVMSDADDLWNEWDVLMGIRDQINELIANEKEIKKEPEEIHYAKFFSHDYPNDTTLKYDKTGNSAVITLTFTSEDPDYGIEELLFNCKADSMAKNITLLLNKISGYLDEDRSSEWMEYVEMPEGIEDLMTTSLYAFEAALTQALKEL